MLIDCADCSMRDIACEDCVVSFLLGPADQGLEPEERAAFAILADGGLVPPLRMMAPTARVRAAPSSGGAGARPAARGAGGESGSARRWASETA